MIGIIAMMFFAIGFSSCEKESALRNSENYSENVEIGSEKGTLIVNDCGAQIKPGETQPFPGEPVHGLPGITTYKFFVANPSSDVIGVDIYFTAPDQNVYVHPMQQNAAGNWYYENPLTQSGHYTMKYHLYTSSGGTLIRTPTPSYVDNTCVYYSNSTLHMKWPFGQQDGSTWINKGSWYMSCGPGGSPSHQNNEFYAQDWTKPGCKGKNIISPVDGVVTHKHQYNGGNLLGITQKIGNTNYVFAVNHLDSYATNINIGTYVQAGITVIGTVGETGNATGPHAHTQVKVNGNSIPIEFSANWQDFQTPQTGFPSLFRQKNYLKRYLKI